MQISYLTIAITMDATLRLPPASLSLAFEKHVLMLLSNPTQASRPRCKRVTCVTVQAGCCSLALTTIVKCARVRHMQCIILV